MFCCCAGEVASSAAIVEHQHVVDLEDDSATSAVSNRGRQAYPSSESRKAGVCFTAVVERQHSGEALGILVDDADGRTLHVCGLISDTLCPARRYNASVPAKRRIQVGDYIVAIDGTSGGAHASKQLLLRLSESLVPAIRVCRPHLFECQVQRKVGFIGLDVTYAQSAMTIVVRGIHPGAVQNCVPQLQVGDRIVSVDGLQDCPPQQLLAALQSSADIVILGMSRPSYLF